MSFEILIIPQPRRLVKDKWQQRQDFNLGFDSDLASVTFAYARFAQNSVLYYDANTDP